MGTPEPFENGFRRVKTNSVEHDAFAAAGWVVIEQDGMTTIMHAPRRASDQATRATAADLLKWRRLEHEVREQLAVELSEALGITIDAGQIRWVLDQFRARVMKEGNGRTVVSGRLR